MARYERPGIGARFGGAALCLSGGYLAIDAISQDVAVFNHGAGILPQSLDLLGATGLPHINPLLYGLATGTTFLVGSLMFLAGSLLNS